MYRSDRTQSREREITRYLLNRMIRAGLREDITKAYSEEGRRGRRVDEKRENVAVFGDNNRPITCVR